MTADLRSILDVAITAADEAGRITLGYFRTSSFEVETKEDSSPVTIADRKAEERIVTIVRKHFPSHAIIGEEHGRAEGADPITWIIDPIDGTKSFIQGVPLYGVLIGVEIEGEARVGVVNFPALGEICYAAQGLGAFWNGRRAAVTATSRLDDAILLTTDVRKLQNDPGTAPGHRALQARVKYERTWGDCYGHMLVATGRADIMLDPKMSVWDSAALKPIVEEAGGIFSDWSGARTIHGGSAISTNGILHNTVLDILHGSASS